AMPVRSAPAVADPRSSLPGPPSRNHHVSAVPTTRASTPSSRHSRKRSTSTPSDRERATGRRLLTQRDSVSQETDRLGPADVLTASGRGSCRRPGEREGPQVARQLPSLDCVHVELLFWEGCPSHPTALADLRDAMADLGLDPATVEVREVTTEAQARQ